MSKRVKLCALLGLICFALVLFSQNVAAPHVGATVSFVKGQINKAAASVGFYNEVTFTKRRCKDYVKNGVVDEKACEADPKTVVSKQTMHNTTMNLGKDFIKAQIFGTGTASNCVFIAVGTEASATPPATNTTMTGEFTTNGMYNGASRWTVGNYTSTGTGTATVDKTFTAVTANTAGVTSAALYTAATAGTMCFEVGGMGPVTLQSATSDTLKVTWSATIT